MSEENIRQWVGYEQRLWKMPVRKIILEAARVGVHHEDVVVALEAGGKRLLIKRILEAQGINDDILKDPP